MILSDVDLNELYDTLFPRPEDRDRSLINPASIDVRIGGPIILLDVGPTELPYGVPSGGFVLVPTLEQICIPNGYAAEIKVKSSAARRGWGHAPTWVDPGWDGILTMEWVNHRPAWQSFNTLLLEKGMRMAQLVIHRLTSNAAKPYAGRYQGATGAERAKQ